VARLRADNAYWIVFEQGKILGQEKVASSDAVAQERVMKAQKSKGKKKGRKSTKTKAPLQEGTTETEDSGEAEEAWVEEEEEEFEFSPKEIREASSRAYKVLFNSVNRNVHLQLATEFEEGNPARIFQAMETRYGTNPTSEISDDMMVVVNMRQVRGVPMVEMIAKLERACQTLERRGDPVSESTKVSVLYNAFKNGDDYAAYSQVLNVSRTLKFTYVQLRDALFEAELNLPAAKPATQVVAAAEVPKKGKGRVCYNCEQPGHIAANCPNPKRVAGGGGGRGGGAAGGGGGGNRNAGGAKEEGCLYCKKKNHTAQQCFSLIKLMKDRENQNASKEVVKAAVSDRPADDGPATDVIELGLDTMASRHVTGNQGILENLVTTIPTVVQGYNGVCSTYDKVGVLEPFGEMLFVPGAQTLLSFKKLNQDGFFLHLNDKMEFELTGYGLKKLVFSAGDSKVYRCKVRVQHIMSCVKIQPARIKKAAYLHDCLGHPSDEVLIKMLKDNLIDGTEVTPEDVKAMRASVGKCKACVIGKMKSKPQVSSVNPKAVIVGERLVMDIFFFGKIPFLVAVDEASRLILVQQLPSKNAVDLQNAIEAFVSYLNPYCDGVKCIRTDHEAVFLSLHDEWRKRKIVPEVAGPERHAVLVERYIQTLQGRARALIVGADLKLPRKFYPQALLSAAQAMNNVLNGATMRIPIVQVTGINLDVEAHVPAYFGMVALFRVSKPRRSSSKPRAEFGLVLGVVREGKGMLKVYLRDSKTIVDRVQFEVVAVPDEVRVDLEGLDGELTDLDDDVFPEADDPDHTGPETSPATYVDPVDPENGTYWPEPAWRCELVMAATTAAEADMLEAHRLEMEQLVATGTFEPVRLAELTAEQKELIVPAKMLSTVKLDAAGNVIKAKGRLVACGNFSATDPSMEVSSPTPDLTSIHTLLAIASQRRMKIMCCDVKSAFLKAELMGLEAYVRISKKLAHVLDEVVIYEKEADGSIILKLKRPLYGLRESPKLWHIEACRGLTEMGLTQCAEDACVFYMWKGQRLLMLAGHVDDFLIIADDPSDASGLIDLIHERWGISARYADTFDFLGVNISMQMDGRIELHQHGLIDRILQLIGVTTSSPAPSARNLFDDEESEPVAEDKKKMFVSVVMMILFVAKRTWPSLLKEVAVLASKASAPTLKDFNDLLKLCSYLNGVKHFKMVIKVEQLKVCIYADASFATHPDGKSHTGILVFMDCHGCCLYAASRRQKVVTLSSTEAELVAGHDGLMHGLAVMRLLNDIGLMADLVLYEDNLSTIKLMTDGPKNFRSKHINVRYFFIKQAIGRNEVVVHHIATSYQLADILTKPLDPVTVTRLTNSIMNLT